MIFAMVLFVGGGYWFYESHCDTVPITGRKRWLWYNGEYDEEIRPFEVGFLLRQVSYSFIMLRPCKLFCPIIIFMLKGQLRLSMA